MALFVKHAADRCLAFVAPSHNSPDREVKRSQNPNIGDIRRHLECIVEASDKIFISDKRFLTITLIFNPTVKKDSEVYIPL